MPWSNQGGGGWKGGGGPWGQGPGGGGNQQPDLEEIFKRSQDRIKQAWPGSGMNKGLVAILALLGILIMGFYMFTVRVNPDEQGIVTRFGKYDHWLRPGLNFRLPAPIEVVYTPKVTNVNALEMGFRRGNDQRGGSGARDVPEESLMLTGDENIVDVDFIVFWQIKTEIDPRSGKPGVEQFPGARLGAPPQAAAQARAGDLNDRPRRDGLLHQMDVLLEVRAALGVGQHHLEAVGAELSHQLQHAEGIGGVRRLQQEPRSARDRETAQAIVIQGLGLEKIDLRPWPNIQGDPGVIEPLAKLR